MSRKFKLTKPKRTRGETKRYSLNYKKILDSQQKEKELKREIEVRKQAVRDRGITKEDMDEYENDGYSKESWWDGDILVLEAELKGFQEGRTQTLNEVKEKIKKFKSVCLDERQMNKLLSTLDELEKNSQQKQKDNSEGSDTDYLETRSVMGEANKQEYKPRCVDNHSADRVSKGCGKSYVREKRKGRIEGSIVQICNENHLCPSCQEKENSEVKE